MFLIRGELVKNNPDVVGFVVVGEPDNTNGPMLKSCCVALPFTPIVDLNTFFNGEDTPGLPSTNPLPVNAVTAPSSVDEYSYPK